MNIIQFKAENFKNLKAVQIRPDGSLVQLTGKNGAGKSAVLEAIFTTLTGTRIDDPIRHGEETAEVSIDMGDYYVRRKWTGKGEYLKVEGLPKGETPQGFLDKIIGKLSFDPLAFKNYPAKQQVEILKKLVGLDFEDLDKEQKVVFDERTSLNGRVRDTIAQIEGMQAPDPETPDEELSFGDALDEINGLQEKREGWKRAQEARKQLETGIAQAKDGIEARRQQIAKLGAEISGIERAILEDQAKLEQIQIPPEISIAQIMAKKGSLEEIEKKNVAIRSAGRYRKLIKDSNKLRDEAEALSQRLERIQQDRQTRIANAKFPVEGMSFSDAGVLYNGTPMHRLSTGEQIIISTSMGMKLNPSLKVIFIHEGSELDADNLAKMADLAKTEGYTIWMTKVANDGKVGIYLEDGSITAINGEAIPECPHEVCDPESGKCAACGEVGP